MKAKDITYHVVNGAFYHRPSKSIVGRAEVVSLFGEEGVVEIKRHRTSLETVKKVRKSGWRKA